jgi:hypothetical protein
MASNYLPGFSKQDGGNCCKLHILASQNRQSAAWSDKIAPFQIVYCPSGEIGRHSGLKIRRLPEKGRAGSSPASGTSNVIDEGIH